MTNELFLDQFLALRGLDGKLRELLPNELGPRSDEFPYMPAIDFTRHYPFSYLRRLRNEAPQETPEWTDHSRRLTESTNLDDYFQPGAQHLEEEITRARRKRRAEKSHLVNDYVFEVPSASEDSISIYKEAAEEYQRKMSSVLGQSSRALRPPTKGTWADFSPEEWSDYIGYMHSGDRNALTKYGPILRD